MNTYIFEHNGEKINEQIKITYIDEGNISSAIIGNIYNAIDYINNNIEEYSKVKLDNFTGNKIEFIIKNIIRYKQIVACGEYYSIIIKDKKRIRGR